MKKRTVFFVSDQTGITAETLGQSLLTQFEDVSFRRITLPFIASVDKAREAVMRINLTAQVEGFRPIVFATFVQEGLRDIVAQSDGLFLDYSSERLRAVRAATRLTRVLGRIMLPGQARDVLGRHHRGVDLGDHHIMLQ